MENLRIFLLLGGKQKHWHWRKSKLQSNANDDMYDNYSPNEMNVSELLYSPNMYARICGCVSVLGMCVRVYGTHTLATLATYWRIDGKLTKASVTWNSKMLEISMKEKWRLRN